MTNSKPVLASDVRAYFRADEKRMARLTEAEQVSVKPNARGVLHPGVVAKFNKGRKPGRQYVPGAGKAQTAAVRELRTALIAEGKAGKRGPLSKEVLAALKG